MSPAQKYNPDLYHAFANGADQWRIEGPTGQMYTRFKGVHRVFVRPHGLTGSKHKRCSGWRKLPSGPLRVTLDAAIAKAE